MGQRVAQDLDCGGSARVLGLPAPVADDEPARKGDVALNGVVILRDEKGHSENGGTFSAGAFRTRDITTVVSGASYVSLSNNDFTLIAGLWLVNWSAPGYRVNEHYSAIADGSGAVLDHGSCLYASSSHTVVNFSTGCYLFESDGSTALRIVHYCQSTHSTFGFGVAANFAGGIAPSIYTQVTCRKLK